MLLPPKYKKTCKKLNLKVFKKIQLLKANNLLLKKIKPKLYIITGSLIFSWKIRNKYL